MSREDRYFIPFHVRYASEIREFMVILGAVLFYAAYVFSSFFHVLVDKGVRPSVYGLTSAYGAASTAIERLTGIDLGFVSPLPDKEFIFRVQLATYVNERQAQPIIDMAMDQLKTRVQREEALRALLKFPSYLDWIRPMLNDLPKGGMVGLYDEESVPLDNLFRRVRLEGGIQKPLIRAYAEVSLSFMLQVPDDIIRKKTLGWVSDLLAEDALFLIIPRIEREIIPDVRKNIDAALWDIRAISSRSRARELLLPIYRNPPWPSIRTPVAVILARLGDNGAAVYLKSLENSPDWDSSKRTIIRVALARTPYPERLRPSDEIALALRQHDRARREQYQAALSKQHRLKREESTLARLQEPAVKPVEKKPAPVVAMVPKPPVVVAPPPAPPAVKQPSKKAPVVVPPPVIEAPVEPAPVEQPVVVPPPVEEAPAPSKPESNMRYVDMLFEVKDAPAALYANAGDSKASDLELEVGSKGKATFEVLINDEKWYQVKSRRKSGWVKGSALKIYDLAPVSEKPAVAPPPSPVEQAARQEATYFESVEDGVIAREKPNDKAKQVASLEASKPYLAIKSEKVGPDRWFLLKLENGEGWVAGIDLQLAEVPMAMKVQQQMAQQPEIKSAFAAEWVVPSVEGVLVYNRPSIAGKVMQRISPPVIYKVLETSTGGDEWYKIKISEKKNIEGWVQSMDVSLTKP